MTNPVNYPEIDFDRLAELRLRLRHTSEADPALGCAIIALLLPRTIAAAMADAWLRQLRAIGSGLDVTGSVDDALRFLGQLGIGPGWTIIREDHGDGIGIRSNGRHSVLVRHRFLDCFGSGQTAATALVDVAIHVTALGGAGYEEEEVILLSAGDGFSSAHDDAASVDIDDAWSADPVERTRQVIGEFWPNLDGMGRICLKNYDGRFGAMDGYELHAGILRVVDRYEAKSTRFDTLESLLAAGWVLD